MITERFDDRLYCKSELLKDVKHGFTTKCGGFSSGKIEGLNLGFRCGDERENVMKNYKAVSEDLGLPFENIVTAKQTHSTNIRIITEEDIGKGVSRDSDIEETDGLITNCRNIPLVVFYADCVPILLGDSVKGVVAAVHSGWRGTAEGIVSNAIKLMQEKFDCDTVNIRAAIGPSIGQCCFEVGEEVAVHFDKEFVKARNDGKFMIDLWSVNKNLLLNSGVKDENIDVLGMCTMCNSDILYSYRCHGEKTGRMGAFIMID